MSKGYGPLADRPDQPVVGMAVTHESADLHVTGAALYTQDLTGRTLGTLHAWPVQAPHAHARVTALRTDAAYEVPGVVRVLTAEDVPGLNDAGEKHDEPLFPSEVMYHGHAVCWVLGETLEAARLGAARIEATRRSSPSLSAYATATPEMSSNRRLQILWNAVTGAMGSGILIVLISSPGCRTLCR